MATAPSTLSTTDRGVTRSIYSLVVGDYIWHRGAFRRVTGVDGRTVRLGRYVLHSTASTVEAVTWPAYRAEQELARRAVAR